MRIFTVLVFMAAAAALGQTARLGDLGPDSTVVTNAVAGGVVVESDPVALASLAAHTNASSAHTAAQVGAVPGTAGTGGHSLGVDIYRGTDISRTTLSAGGVAVKASIGTTTFGKDGIVKSTAAGTWTLNSTGASLAGFGVPEPWSFAWADLIQRPEMVATNAAIYERIEEKADKTDIGKWSDIATNVVYHVVVSNGHWLIREGN